MSSTPPPWVRHCWSPVATMAKPARSSARETAASWVTTSSHSRPSSSMRSTPASWPWARLMRLMTGVISWGSSSIGSVLLGEGGESGGQALPGVGGDVAERVTGEPGHGVGVEGLHDGGVLVDRAHRDVAGEHGGDGGVDLQRLVGQLGPARAEDDVRRDVDVELRLERRLQVDLGEDAEALVGQGGAHVGDGPVVGPGHRGLERVAHQDSCPSASSCARTCSMSRSRTAVMTCSSAAAGSAPGWEKTSTPSLKAIRVGIEVIRAAPASACSASVSTDPKNTSVCVSDAS